MTAQTTPITPAPAISPDAAVSLKRSQCCGCRIAHSLAAIAPLNITHDCSGKMMNARPMLVPLGTNLQSECYNHCCLHVTTSRAAFNVHAQVCPAAAAPHCKSAAGETNAEHHHGDHANPAPVGQSRETLVQHLCHFHPCECCGGRHIVAAQHIGGREQQINWYCYSNANKNSHELREKLLLWRLPEQQARLEVLLNCMNKGDGAHLKKLHLHHVTRLARPCAADGCSHKVRRHVARCNQREHKLRDLKPKCQTAATMNTRASGCIYLAHGPDGIYISFP